MSDLWGLHIAANDEYPAVAPKIKTPAGHLLDNLSKEFNTWLDGQGKWEKDNGILDWHNVENFMKEHYPAAHRGLWDGQGEAAPLLEGKNPVYCKDCGDELGGNYCKYCKSSTPTPQHIPYETGNNAIEKYGYDPKEIAAGMVFLHSFGHQSLGHLGREDYFQENLDRLTDIYQKRQKMHDIYQKRQKMQRGYENHTASTDGTGWGLHTAADDDDYTWDSYDLPSLWQDYHHWWAGEDGDPEDSKQSIQDWSNVESYLHENHGLPHAGFDKTIRTSVGGDDWDRYYQHPATVAMAKLHSLAQCKNFFDDDPHHQTFSDDEVLQGAALGLLKIRRNRHNQIRTENGLYPTASTDGIRYAQVVEADVAEDLRRVAMPWPDWADKIQHIAPDGGIGLYYVNHDGGRREQSQLAYSLSPDSRRVNVHGLYTNEDHRNDGLAEAMIRRLHEDHPDYRINPGGMTDDGQAFHDKMLEKDPSAKGVLARLAMADTAKWHPLIRHDSDIAPLSAYHSATYSIAHPNDPSRTIAVLDYSLYPAQSAAQSNTRVVDVLGHPEAYVDALMVHPEHQGQGVAQALVERLARDYPKHRINPGKTTPQGNGFTNRMMGFGEDRVVPGYRPRVVSDYGVADFEEKMKGRVGSARIAMPLPMPEGVTFHHHPTDDTIPAQFREDRRDHAFYAPAVEARHDGRHIGYLAWTDGSPEDGGRPVGEINHIKVHPDYRRHGIATALFDFAREHEPNLHHSSLRSELGEAWVRHEQDRHRTAMPAPMPEGITFHHHPTNDTVPSEPWAHDPTVLVPQFSAPAVEARHNGQTVGYLEWDPPLHATVVNGIQYGDHPPEVSMIKVHPDYRRHGIATALFDFARQHQGDLEHSDSRTELGNKWVDYEQGRKTAMPAPLPKGVFFRYHPELMWSPGVTAHLPGGKQVGSLEWYDDDHVMVDLGTRRPGEIDRISVHPDHQGQSIATSMFDFAKQHEPRLHHSDQLTDDGRGWSEYERSRNARLAMAWQDWAPQIKNTYGGCEPGQCHQIHPTDNVSTYHIEHGDGDHSYLRYSHEKNSEGKPVLSIRQIYTGETNRHDGVAEALMRRLIADHPGHKIDPGRMTGHGQGFHDHMLGKEPDARSVLAGRNGDPPPMTFEPFNTMWSNGIMARHAEDGRPIAHLHWYPDGEIESIRVHPEMQGRDIGKHILAHAVMNPDTYEAPRWGIQPSNHMTEAGRAYARSLGYNPPDEEVTPADNDVTRWGWTAVRDYVPLSVPYTGQNEEEMKKHLDNEWTPLAPKTASTEDEGWPVWWRGRHRPAGPFDKRWHPNHPEHVPAPWAD